MAKKVIKGEKQNVEKRTRVLNLRKTKTLNNFNKNQIQLRYFVIFLAIIKLVRQMCVGDLHVILNIETQTRYDLVFPPD